MVTKIVLALLGLIVVVNGQLLFVGQCNNVTTQQNFNVANYSGLWYEIRRYDTILEPNGECATTNYTVLPTYILVNNSFLSQGKRQNIVANATVNATTHDGRLNVTFPGNIYGDYLILGTDYTNYSIIWSCIQANNSHNLQFSWILSRKPYLNNAAERIVTHILQQNKINETVYRKIKQDDKTCRSSSAVVGASLVLLTFSLILSM